MTRCGRGHSENLEQVKFLRASGCDQAQGYYYSRPVSAERLLPLTRRPAVASARIAPHHFENCIGKLIQLVPCSCFPDHSDSATRGNLAAMSARELPIVHDEDFARTYRVWQRVFFIGVMALAVAAAVLYPAPASTQSSINALHLNVAMAMALLGVIGALHRWIPARIVLSLAGVCLAVALITVLAWLFFDATGAARISRPVTSWRLKGSSRLDRW